MDSLQEKISSVLSDEESMRQLRELAEMLGLDPSGGEGAGGSAAGGTPPVGDNPLGGLDIGAIYRLMNTGRQDGDAALLLALKPHLSAERQERVDRAVKLLKLAAIFTALKDSGLLSNLEKLI